MSVKKNSTWKKVLFHIILIISVIIAVYPALRVFGTSLRPGNSLHSTSLAIIPDNATLDAYKTWIFDTEFLEKEKSYVNTTTQLAYVIPRSSFHLLEKDIIEILNRKYNYNYVPLSEVRSPIEFQIKRIVRKQFEELSNTILQKISNIEESVNQSN